MLYDVDNHISARIRDDPKFSWARTRGGTTGITEWWMMLRQCKVLREIVQQIGWYDFIEALEPIHDGASVPLGVNMTEENVRNMLGPHCGDIFPKNWYISLAVLRSNFSVPELELDDEASRDNPKVIEVTRAFLFFVAGHTFLSSSSGYIKSGYLTTFSDFDLICWDPWKNYLVRRDQRAIHAMSPSMLRFLLRGPDYCAWEKELADRVNDPNGLEQPDGS
ncbi:hypothetical protein C5167_011388 [Papaver somniferum]|uniref:Uncharacterized protein n=1 Tax=Papaver somniferum TaxID=3469 RepID=A0A4Y7K6T4_PAPSO|nr:hypothetical protein C5167_011388 [Papaver somniferum]